MQIENQENKVLWWLIVTGDVLLMGGTFFGVYALLDHYWPAVSCQVTLPTFLTVALGSLLLLYCIVSPTPQIAGQRPDRLMQRSFRLCVLHALLMGAAFFFFLQDCGTPRGLLLASEAVWFVVLAVVRLIEQWAFVSAQRVHEMPVPELQPLNHWYNRVVKRVVDIAVSLLLLATIFPFVYVVAAICIKRQSPGHVFQIRRRKSLDGNVFGCVFFRATQQGLSNMPADEGERDPRWFPFGNWLRRTGMEALPQLLNVLCGDMSLVGPRPCAPAQADDYRQLMEQFAPCHTAKPGMTGWAQKQGCTESSVPDEMKRSAEADWWYEQHWNFWLDLCILLTCKKKK